MNECFQGQTIILDSNKDWKGSLSWLLDKTFSLNISYFKFFGRPSYFTRKSLSWKKLWGYWTDLTLKWFLELAAFGLTDKSIKINKCFDCKNCLETYFRIIDFLLTYLIFQKSSVNNLLSWKNRGGTQWKKRKPL